MKAGLKKLLADDTDSVLLWMLRDSKRMDRQIIGSVKLPVPNIF